jgi:predicted transcriptional regulator
LFLRQIIFTILWSKPKTKANLMSEVVTLELPDDLVKRARAVAARTNRPFNEVLVEWIDRAGAEPSIELLSDEQVLALCDSELEPAQQEQLSELLAKNREGQVSKAERQQLDELMSTYRRGLLRKAQALRVAVARGLKPRLS